MGSDDGETMTPADAESVRLILDYAREQYDRIDSRHESAVGRSSTFLGLGAVVIGLVAAAPFHGLTWRIFSAVGLIVMLAALVLFVTVAMLKTYVSTPDVGALIDGYLGQSADEIRRQVLSNTRVAIRDNEATLGSVQRRYVWATRLAVTGIVIIGAGVILAILTE